MEHHFAITSTSVDKTTSRALIHSCPDSDLASSRHHIASFHVSNLVNFLRSKCEHQKEATRYVLCSHQRPAGTKEQSVAEFNVAESYASNESLHQPNTLVSDELYFVELASAGNSKRNTHSANTGSATTCSEFRTRGFRV